MTLLATDPNLHLLGSTNLAASAVYFFASDLPRAVEHAQKAADLGLESGHARIRMAATANLGLLQLHLGELDSANQHLTEALELCKRFSVSQASLLDSYAHLQLMLGHQEECGRLLDEVDGLVSVHEPTDLSSQRLAVIPTRLRYLIQAGLWNEVATLAARSIQIADRKEDRPHGVSLRVLGADALIELGRTDEAAAWVDEAARQAEGAPTATYAEVERARAALVAHTLGASTAKRQFDRALRVLAAEGGAAARMDAAGSYLRTMKPANERLRRLLADKPFDLSPLVSSGRQESTAPSRHRPGSAPNPRAVGLSEAAPLMRLAQRADLLAHEAFVLVRESGCAEALAVLENEGEQVVNVAAHIGCTADEAAQLPASTAVVIMRAGETRGRDISVVARPHPAVETRSFVQDVKTIVESAWALQALRDEERIRAAAWPPDLSPVRDDGVFASESMLQLLATARQVARGNDSILITGESGTGKELLARIIHKYSPRADRDFVPFNCAGVPKDMVESQLFGHRRGAFTGAQDDSKGVIRAASGGTLLLDEVGELEPSVQPKLLRFLEQSEVHPLGEPRPVNVDVRVIAATNADVDEYVRDGRFREDLFYRFIIRLDIPPLRERREEIPPLVHHFLRQFGGERGLPA